MNQITDELAQKIIEVFKETMIFRKQQAEKALSMAVTLQDRSFHRGRVYELEDVLDKLIKVDKLIKTVEIGKTK